MMRNQMAELGFFASANNPVLIARNDEMNMNKK